MKLCELKLGEMELSQKNGIKNHSLYDKCCLFIFKKKW